MDVRQEIRKLRFDSGVSYENEVATVAPELRGVVPQSAEY
jgi:hypothetical protein